MKKTFLFLFLLFLTAGITAQKKPFTIEDLYRVKNCGSPVPSPSGKYIAFTLTSYDLKDGEYNIDIYLMNRDGSQLRNLTSTDSINEDSPIWLSDDQLLFLSESQIYRVSASGYDTVKLTDISTGINNPVLSPDNNLIAFTTDIFPECGTDDDCNRMLNESAENGPVQAYDTDELLFRHWVSYNEELESHLFIYDIKNQKYSDIGKSEWLSDNFKLGGDVKYSFSPDSKEICFIKNPDPDPASSTNSDIWIAPLNMEEAVNITVQNKAWDGFPQYSPDGNFIAYKMQAVASYEADRYRIALYDRKNKTAKVLTEKFDNTINDFCWSSDSREIYFTADVEGYTPIFKIDINSGKISQVSDKHAVFGYDLSDNSIFFTASSVDKPKEVFRLDPGTKTPVQLTSFNKNLLDEVDFRPAEQIWVEGAAGRKVHVFLVKPHGFDPEKKYPLILNVHGGPQSQWMDSFRGDWQVYPGSGYIVAFPNPHGSTGYGSAYTEAISGDWGGKVFEDLMKVTDSLEQIPYVDKERIGAMGWSFGGYMMNWFQAKTKRFKCLASMMGIFDLKSMWGTTEELWFVNWDLKGQPWNSEDYQKWSPSSYIENFSTPALIITGEKDYRVPYTQSVQYFTTLKTLGIDSRLIIFKNDGHWPSHVKSMPLYYNSHLEWFYKYLGGKAPVYDSRKMLLNIQFKEEKAAQ